ncbi:MAG: NADH-quinone oxidoreductase subunit NuoK [Planctomycetes bacterium]|nr:NADH-quinone oxidoreductase subunit NuoK [Planctomycetota bacterium]
MHDSTTQNLLVFAGLLFSVGLVGFLTRRSLILMFLSLEMMLAGVSVNLIAFSKHYGNYQGQVLAIMVLSIAACEAAIALALVVSLYRRKATLDVKEWGDLSETIVPKEVETVGSMETEAPSFPTLTPAGLDPLADPVPSEFKAELGSVPVIIDKKVEASSNV